MSYLTEPFEVFCIYCSLKAHYTGKYDYFAYNKQINVNYSSFVRRNDKLFFHKIAKKYTKAECEVFFATNFAYNHRFWIGEFDDREIIDIYKQHLKIINAFDYYLKKDIKILEENGGFINTLKMSNNPYPDAIYLLKSNDISFETLTVLYNVLELYKYWKIKDTIWYPNLKLKLRKFYPFLNIQVPYKERVQFIKNMYREVIEEL